MARQTKTIPPGNTAAAALTTGETVYEAGGRIGQTCQYPAGTSCGSYSSRHVDFAYDNVGRPLTKKTWDRGASPAADSLKFTKTLTWNMDGSPASANEGSDTLSYLYDNAGRLCSTSQRAMRSVRSSPSARVCRSQGLWRGSPSEAGRSLAWTN